MRTQLQSDDLLVAIHELCPRAKLCKIATVSELVQLDAPALVEALAPAVAAYQVIVLGAPRPTGFLWLTARGVREARRIRAERRAAGDRG